jgi:hypothetical protein
MALPPPEVIAAAIQVAGQMGSKIGEREYPVGTTYDDLQRALGFLRRKYGQASNIFQEGGTIGDYEFRGGVEILHKKIVVRILEKLMKIIYYPKVSQKIMQAHELKEINDYKNKKVLENTLKILVMNII